MIRIGRLGAVVAALLLACCAPGPEPADPAIWLVEGPDGQKAWLFGTIHSLERPAQWRTPPVGAALSQADTLIVEIAGLDNGATTARIFEELARTPGQPALSRRVEPDLRPALARVLERHGLKDDGFASVETWAAALTLARAESGDSKSQYGIDKAVMAAARDKPVIELEGAQSQLRLFDALPEREQRDLLAAVIADAGTLAGEGTDLAEAWRRGDLQTIERETRRGMLADPELREALFTGRNHRWTERIAGEMASGKRPFVAVGAAHMAGPEGLPAMLEARGYEVSRIR